MLKHRVPEMMRPETCGRPMAPGMTVQFERLTVCACHRDKVDETLNRWSVRNLER